MSKSNSSNIFSECPEAFRMQVSTATLKDELKNTKDIDAYLKKNKKNMIPHNLPIHLSLLLNQKKMRVAQVARDSLFDRKYIYQVFSGEKTPSRDKLIAIAFGLHLSAEEAQTMLKVSENRELYIRDKRDAIILFALQRGMSIFETNDLLFDHNFDILGVPKK